MAVQTGNTGLACFDFSHVATSPPIPDSFDDSTGRSSGCWSCGAPEPLSPQKNRCRQANEDGQLGIRKNPGADQFGEREEAFLYAHVFLRKTYKGIGACMLGIIL